jgi:hypothetical protein
MTLEQWKIETYPGTVEAHPTLEAMKTLLVTAEARTEALATQQWTMDPHPGASGVPHLGAVELQPGDGISPWR